MENPFALCMKGFTVGGIFCAIVVAMLVERPELFFRAIAGVAVFGAFTSAMLVTLFASLAIKWQIRKGKIKL